MDVDGGASGAACSTCTDPPPEGAWFRPLNHQRAKRGIPAPASLPTASTSYWCPVSTRATPGL